MKLQHVALRRLGILLFFALCVLSGQQLVAASPFGQGVFGADVPFGAATSIAIALGGNVNLNLVPSGSNFTASGSHTLTVTSTDVVGYSLYIYSPSSTNMSSGTSTIPTSSNGSPAPLSVNTWGYNTDGSNNYVGMTSTPALLKTATGPYKTGDNTTVTYGVLTSIITGAGSYNVAVTYSAVALTD